MIDKKDNPTKKFRINSGSTEEDRVKRIEAIERMTNSSLTELATTTYSSKEVEGNIESYLGSIEIPVGLAGPIKMIHDNGELEDIYAPVATNEGALIASMTRGAYAISLSGGFDSKVIRQRMSRCPMFCFKNMRSATVFSEWINKNFDSIKKETQKYSNHANLVEVIPQIFGKNIHLRFEFETGDASGQNMTTTCTWNACLWIENKYNSQTKIEQNILSHAIEANGSSDKKLSSRSMISTRGIRVVAECHFPERVLKRVLKVSSQDIIDLYIKANPMAVNDGMSGYNVNTANAIAAFFASTGQDLACIHESSAGILQVEKTEEGLYMAITLPSLVIGTIGGGTGLKGPKEILKILKCNGPGTVQRLAKIIAGYALGLELSTMSAIMSGHFATSHERLGRNRPIELLKEHELNLEFFQKNLNISNIQSVQLNQEMEIKNGIVSEVTSKVSKKPIGFYPFTMTIDEKHIDTVLKLKPLDEEILLGFEIIAGLVSNDLKLAFSTWKKKNAFINSHNKEVEAYKSLNQSHPQYIPKLYGTTKIVDREIYAIAKEYLNSKDITHFNTENNPSVWTYDNKLNVIKAIAEIHSDYFQLPNHFATSNLNLEEKINLIPFYQETTEQAFMALEWFTAEEKDWFNKINLDLSKWYKDYLELPKTFIHNDFSPRNICLRKNGTPCFYDWELCEIAPPQRDFIEFMAFTQDGQTDFKEFEKLSRIHFNEFINATNLDINFHQWQMGLLVSSYDFLIDRLSFYMIGNIINQYKFLKRVYFSTKSIIQYLESTYCKT
ncbi:MAG: hydroxymethylglutaryl-CoA reductase (NADPH) [Bacteriovoracaceae bacterium]|jgi:hydroxymethylglutaryl-CoA reductase (NADPH)